MDATFTLKLSPREFDLVRTAIDEAILESAKLANHAPHEQRRAHRERNAQLRELRSSLG